VNLNINEKDFILEKSIILEIFYYLIHEIDIKNLSLVCKDFNEIISESSFLNKIYSDFYIKTDHQTMFIDNHFNKKSFFRKHSSNMKWILSNNVIKNTFNIGSSSNNCINLDNNVLSVTGDHPKLFYFQNGLFFYNYNQFRPFKTFFYSKEYQ
jgi:hypothetical protein